MELNLQLLLMIFHQFVCVTVGTTCFREKRPTTHHFCLHIGAHGLLEGKVVTCNEPCSDPCSTHLAKANNGKDCNYSETSYVNENASERPVCTGPGRYQAHKCDEYHECVQVGFSWQSQLKNCPDGEAFDWVSRECNTRVLCENTTNVNSVGTSSSTEVPSPLTTYGTAPSNKTGESPFNVSVTGGSRNQPFGSTNNDDQTTMISKSTIRTATHDIANSASTLLPAIPLVDMILISNSTDNTTATVGNTSFIHSTEWSTTFQVSTKARATAEQSSTITTPLDEIVESTVSTSTSEQSILLINNTITGTNLVINSANNLFFSITAILLTLILLLL